MSLSRLFLIDAHALCYRSFFAIRGLTNSKGQATNAVYGFVNALKKLIREHQPEYVAVCFDMKGKTRRQEKFAEYKIQRPAMPDDLISQIPIIREVVKAYNFPILETEGYEADDIIATIARRLDKPDLEIVIVTDDKDMFQLVGKRVKILTSRQDEIMDEVAVEKFLGFRPELIPDYLALTGDSVDNIPGVKGIGDVSATHLVTEFGTLEKILKNLDKIKPERAKQAISSQQEIAKLSKELALLEDNAPIKIDLETMHAGRSDREKLKVLFNDLEFRKFVAELNEEEPPKTIEIVVIPVKSEAELKKLTETIKKEKQFAFFLDPQSIEGPLAPVQQMMVCGKGGEIYQVSLSRKDWFIELFENKSVLKITHDVKTQLKSLGWQPAGFSGGVFDTFLAGFLASPGKANYDLPALAWEYLKVSVSENPDEARSVQLICQLYEPLAKEMKERDLWKLFDELELPLAFVLLQMERDGVKLDEALLAKLSVETGKKIDALVKDIYQLAGQEFNLNSPKQLGEVLFEKLKLPPVKKTKTGYSTDESVLVKLSEIHEMPAKLLEYRQLAKLKSTYIDALPKLVDSQGHLHTSFNQAGAETGRLSSNNPNLQNIPIRNELGRQIRAAFIPSDKNHIIIAADYSQIELRVLAHMSQDKNLQAAFQKGQDIHSYTAAQILEVDEKDLTPEMRNRAKRVNFGIIYGMSAFGLSKDLGISQGEAQDFIDRYFLRYPAVKTFMDAQIAKCRKDGFVTTILNRRRYIPEINNSNIGIRQFAERQAINTPVQGSAADMIKLAMIDIAKVLREKKFDSRMIITVHDELVFDAVVAEEKDLISLVRSKMENTMKLSVPIVVTIKKGKNWLEMEKITE